VIEHLVEYDGIAKLGHVLGCNDNVVNCCILEGFSNILETGMMAADGSFEKYSTLIEESGALDKIEKLQECENEVIPGLESHIQRLTLFLASIQECKPHN